MANDGSYWLTLYLSVSVFRSKACLTIPTRTGFKTGKSASQLASQAGNFEPLQMHLRVNIDMRVSQNRGPQKNVWFINKPWLLSDDLGVHLVWETTMFCCAILVGYWSVTDGLLVVVTGFWLLLLWMIGHDGYRLLIIVMSIMIDQLMNLWLIWL